MNILLHEAPEHADAAASGGTAMTIVLLIGLLLLAGIIVYTFRTRIDGA
jgi:hypothetical protein